MRILLTLIALLVPRHERPRWLEEWRAELQHGRWTMIFGALPDAWAMRRVAKRAGRDKSPSVGLPPSGGRRWTGACLVDAKQTLRSLARSPWHVATVSTCLGIGIAVSVAVFSILSSILTGPLPGIEDRDRLMRVVITADQPWGRGWAGASLADFEMLAAGSPHMTSMAAEGGWHFAVRTPHVGPLAVDGAFVSGTYFETLGTRPSLGRLLTPADDRDDAVPAVVLSHAFWTATLGAPADIIGATIHVGGQDVFVAGVAPERFSGMDVGALGEPPGLRYKIYLPLHLSRLLAPALDRREGWLNIIGRAAPGVSMEALSAELQPIAARMAREDPVGRKNAALLVMNSGASGGDTTAEIAAIVALLMAAPLTVLAIGCANVANLQLVRASKRGRELAVRLSIGASRWQLVRLLSIEAGVLALAACAAGMGANALLLRMAARVIPFHVEVDGSVLFFVVAIAVVVVIATGVFPGWLATRSRESLNPIGSNRSGAPGASWARRVLVVAQIALCLVLLITAALFTRTLKALLGRIPPIAHEVAVAEIRFDTLGYSQAERTAFIHSLESRLRADTRVHTVGFNTMAPFRGVSRRVWLPGDDPDLLRTADGGEVTPGWFDAAGLVMIRGRTFTPDEVRQANAAIVDRGFVERYGLPEPVVGTQLRVERTTSGRGNARSINQVSGPAVVSVTIVGVVGNTLPPPIVRKPAANLYLPMGDATTYVAAYVRTNGPASIAGQIRETMKAIDPDLPPIRIATLAARYQAEAGDFRLIAGAASGLGAAALFLAVAGVYSVIAFFVSLRTHEFGIRLAIGARPNDITNMVVMEASRLVGAGLLAGLVLGVPVLIFLGKAFRYTSAIDPLGLLGPLAALTLTALIGAGIPARKAARVDPCAALRSE